MESEMQEMKVRLPLTFKIIKESVQVCPQEGGKPTKISLTTKFISAKEWMKDEKAF